MADSIQPLDKRPLDELVQKVKAFADGADEQVIEAARNFREIRRRIESGDLGEGVKWQAWMRKNIRLKIARLYELMAIAEATDPHAELERQRERNRDRQKKYRERHLKKELANDPERVAVIELIKHLPIDQVRKVRKFIDRLPPIGQ